MCFHVARSRALPLIFPVPLLIAVYVGLTFFPLAVAWLDEGPSRGFFYELSSGLGLTAFALLLLQFLTSGRFEALTGRVGIDLTMRLHQLIARTLTVFLVVHPPLYAIWPGQGGTAGRIVQMFTSPAYLSGVLAWVLLLVVVFAGVLRDRLPVRYEIWRASHGVGALLLAIFGVHHALYLGRYSAHPAIAAFWFVLLGVAVLSLLTVYVLRPLALRRQPYRLIANENVGDRLWELELEPIGDFRPSLTAGQFYWVTFGDSPFLLREHPFSASSASSELPRVRFIIKESGDFTRTIGTIPLGTRAFLDGPRGIFTLEDRQATGIGLVAGGVGIAPILSILRELRARGDRRPIRLLYGNRHPGQIVRREEIQAISADLDFDARFVVAEPPEGWTGGTGELDRAQVAAYFDNPDRAGWVYFVCGPNAMMSSVERSLEAIGVPPRSIVTERFRYE
jgi:predicted ferric reductase